LGLQFRADGETATHHWSIVLRFKDGGLLSLTFDTEDYLGCDAALTRICESTNIPRSD
jgi:hypothetical protein